MQCQNANYFSEIEIRKDYIFSNQQINNSNYDQRLIFCAKKAIKKAQVKSHD